MNALIPLLVNIIIIYGLSITIFVYTGKDIPSLIMMILTPALTIGNNIWGYVAIVVFGNLLWLFGINGTSIIFPLVFSLGIANTGINAELIKSGQVMCTLSRTHLNYQHFFVYYFLYTLRDLSFLIFFVTYLHCKILCNQIYLFLTLLS